MLVVLLYLVVVLGEPRLDHLLDCDQDPGEERDRAHDLQQKRHGEMKSTLKKIELNITKN